MDPVFILLRVLVPLTIFRYPLAGGFASFFLDGADWGINFFTIPSIHASYPVIDKLLDVYYYSIEAFVVLSWTNGWAKKTALALYVWRAIGIVLYIFTLSPLIPILFPNVFEEFFLMYLTIKFLLQKEPRFSWRQILLALMVLGVPKIFQEYSMYISQPLDWRFVRLVLPNGHAFVYDNLDHQVAIVVVFIVIMSAVFMRQKRTRGERR